MLGRIMLFLGSLSAFEQAIVFPVFFVGVTWFGILFIRPFFRFWLRKQQNTNDLVSFTSTGFSLFYGLLLGLLSVATYGNLKEAEQFSTFEASSLATIYKGSGAYPEPLRGELQSLLRDYTLYVINKDWPAHRKGLVLMGGDNRLQVIRSDLLAFEPQTKTQEILHTETLSDFNDLIRFREQRVASVNVAIPGVLWYVVIVGAAINVLLTLMLDVRFTVHLIFGGLVSFFLGVMIFLIYAMDHPLSGGVTVTSDAYRNVYDLVMRWDESG